MVQRLQEAKSTRSVTTLIVTVVLVVLVVAGGVAFWSVTRPCGAGAGDPEEAVSAVLAALQEDDERGLCQRVSSDYRVPEDEVAVLRERVSALGGVEEVSVTEVAEQQMGGLHVLVATAPGGQLIGRFQTIPGQRGAVVVRATSSVSRW